MGLYKSTVSELRKEFPALERTIRGEPIIFFDGPGGTQVHVSVLEAVREYLTESNSNAHGSFHHSRRTDEATYKARQAVSDFFNASRPEEIVFGPNMTTLTFRISQVIGETLKPGDEVVVTRLEHDANIAPWLALKNQGIVIRHVDFNPMTCTLDMHDMENAINERTKLVAIGYASNAVGTVNNVRLIADLAHHVGAWVYVDAVHYAPHGPIDVKAIGCDFLVCSAYKIFGPHLGILYGRYELLDGLPARKVRPAGNAPPDKFETGTNSFESISGTGAAIEYLASVGRRFGSEYLKEFSHTKGRRLHLKTGMAAIRAYENGLCQELIEGLSQIPGLSIYGITEPTDFDHRVPTVSFTLEGLTPTEIARRLDERNIFVWDGNFYALAVTERLGLEQEGGMVRVGLCHYNTSEEVNIFLGVMAEMRH